MARVRGSSTRRKGGCWRIDCYDAWNGRWFGFVWLKTEEKAQVALAKLALQHGGQWRIVKEE